MTISKLVSTNLLLLLTNLFGLLFSVVYQFIAIKYLSIDQFGILINQTFMMALIVLCASGIHWEILHKQNLYVKKNKFDSFFKRNRLSNLETFLLFPYLILGISLSIIAIFIQLVFHLQTLHYLPVLFFIPVAAFSSVVFGRLFASDKILKANFASMLQIMVKVLVLLLALVLFRSAFAVNFIIVIFLFLFSLILFFASSLEPNSSRSQKGSSRFFQITTVAYWFAISSDVVSVRFALSSEESGVYGYVATISRFALFLPIFLTQRHFNNFNVGKQSSKSLRGFAAITGVLYSIFGLTTAIAGQIVLDILIETPKSLESVYFYYYFLTLVPVAFSLPLLQKVSGNQRSHEAWFFTFVTFLVFFIQLFLVGSILSLMLVQFVCNTFFLALLLYLVSRKPVDD